MFIHTFLKTLFIIVTDETDASFQKEPHDDIYMQESQALLKPDIYHSRHADLS